MKIWGVTDYEKKIIIYKDNKDKSVMVFDGEEQKTMTYKEFRNEKQNYHTSKYAFIKCDNGKTLQESHKDFITDAYILKNKTNGMINMFKSGSEASTALSLFMFLYTLAMPDKIEADEAEWLIGATMGALTHVQIYTGPGYKYDTNSMYPSIMKCKYMLFPMKRGRFVKVDTLSRKGFNGMSIWRCKIQKSNDPNLNKQFKFNDRNYYTNMDLIRAEKLGFNIELIKDTEYNVLIYEQKECIKGYKLFGQFVNFMFSLKKFGVGRSKAILNSLWGKLCEKKLIKKTLNINDTNIHEIYPGKKIIGLIPFGNNGVVITLSENSTVYKTDFARIGPFLLARGRYIMGEMIDPHASHIRYLHTDGFISDCKLDIETGEDIGDLRYEGYCEEVNIVGLTKKYGEFKID